VRSSTRASNEPADLVLRTALPECREGQQGGGEEPPDADEPDLGQHVCASGRQTLFELHGPGAAAEFKRGLAREPSARAIQGVRGSVQHRRLARASVVDGEGGVLLGTGRHDGVEQVVGPEGAEDEPEEALPALRDVSGHDPAGIDRHGDEEARLLVGVDLLHELDARRCCRQAGVACPLDHVAPDRVGHHVEPDGGFVARVRRLGEQDRADHRVVGRRAHAEAWHAQGLGLRGEPLAFGVRHGRREPDPEDPGIQALEFDALDVRPELGQRDGVAVGREQAGAATQQGDIGPELVLDRAQLDLGRVEKGQAVAQIRRPPNQSGAHPGREQASGQDRARDPARRFEGWRP
jgi:hypothetical protein